MKERKLNLEPLIPPPPSSLQLPSMQSRDHPPRTDVEHEPQAQQLTIFYNGQVSTCSVDEFQARAILSVARREIEETVVSPTRRSSSSFSSQVGLQAQLGGSLSMKRSLQQFLHKRNHRRINSPNPPPHQ